MRRQLRGKGPHREQEFRVDRYPPAACGEPSRTAVEREHARRDEAVEVEVVVELLVPGMEDSSDADETALVVGELLKGLRDSLEEESFTCRLTASLTLSPPA